MKVYENLEEMSFISVNFSTLFYKRNRKLSPTLKELKNVPKQLAITTYVRCRFCVFEAEFFLLPLASCTSCHIRVTNIYFCQLLLSNVVLSSDSEKGEISLIVVGAPKLWQKGDNADFQVFLAEIWKLCNNRQTADYGLTAIPWWPSLLILTCIWHMCS